MDRTAALLRETFGGRLFDDDRYLRWFYRQNPVGAAIEVDVDEGADRLGHLAGIPQIYQRGGEELPIVFPLHIAVSLQARGRGLMTRMSEQCFREAAEHLGVTSFVGMPNASSTPGYTGRLGFRLVRPLPVQLCLPVPPRARAVRSVPVTEAYLCSEECLALAGRIDFSATAQWSQRWSETLLRWRLAAPGRSYSVHEDEHVVAISTRTCAAGIPVAALLKLFSKRSSPAGRLGAGRMVAAACRFHRVPFVVYAGFNARIRVRGFPIPVRLRPSPLNLIFRSLSPARIDQAAFQFDSFEFLDFDAY